MGMPPVVRLARTQNAGYEPRGKHQHDGMIRSTRMNSVGTCPAQVPNISPRIAARAATTQTWCKACTNQTEIVDRSAAQRGHLEVAFAVAPPSLHRYNIG